MRIDMAMILPREAASVPMARHMVTTALKDAAVDSDCVAEAELALSEACTNVVLHAQAGESYEVRINIAHEQLTMDVVDTGSGFGSFPVQGSAMADVDAVRGRGLALMQALTDQAAFDSVMGGDGGSVHLVKRLRWSETRRATGSDAARAMRADMSSRSPDATK